MSATFDHAGTLSRRTGHRERAQVTITNIGPVTATLTSVTLLDSGQVALAAFGDEPVVLRPGECHPMRLTYKITERGPFHIHTKWTNPDGSRDERTQALTIFDARS
jgi:hypothetical protein